MIDTLLDESLELWGFTRAGVIEEVENLPAGRFDDAPADGFRTVTGLCRHIIESGLLMVGELTREDGDFQRQAYGRHLNDYAPHVHDITGKKELIEALRATHEAGVAQFQAAGELFLLRPIRRFDGEVGTRLAWLNHGIEHESYHRGQLALTARVFGLVPALTRLIHG
jgi:uncharacterized damage-inducible protein DinB